MDSGQTQRTKGKNTSKRKKKTEKRKSQAFSGGNNLPLVASAETATPPSGTYKS